MRCETFAQGQHVYTYMNLCELPLLKFLHFYKLPCMNAIFIAIFDEPAREKSLWDKLLNHSDSYRLNYKDKLMI